MTSSNIYLGKSLVTKSWIIIFLSITMFNSSVHSQSEITDEEKRIMAKYTHPVHEYKDQLGAPPYQYNLSDFTFQTQKDIFIIRQLKDKSFGEPSRSYIQYVFHEDRKLSSRTDIIKDKVLEKYTYENDTLVKVEDLKNSITYVRDPIKNIFHKGSIDAKEKKIHFEKRGTDGKNFYFNRNKKLTREVTFKNNKITRRKVISLKVETIFKYDKSNRLTHRIAIKNTDKEIPDTTFKTTYKYDSLGFLIQQEDKSYVTNKTQIHTYEYKFEKYLKKLPELIVYTKIRGKTPSKKESYFFDEFINLVDYREKSSRFHYKESFIEYKFKNKN